jgi:hypothetical protein
MQSLQKPLSSRPSAAENALKNHRISTGCLKPFNAKINPHGQIVMLQDAANMGLQRFDRLRLIELFYYMQVQGHYNFNLSIVPCHKIGSHVFVIHTLQKHLIETG